MTRIVRKLARRVARRVPVVALAVGLALAVAPIASAANIGVDIAGFAFSPQTVTVHVGDTVTWSNADAQSHTATADNGSFDTGTISGGSSKSVTLSAAGTFAYHCKIHPAMTATVVVQATAAPATDVIAPASPASRISDGGAWLPLGLAALLGLELGRRRFAWRRT
jgi:plastocyanin